MMNKKNKKEMMPEEKTKVSGASLLTTSPPVMEEAVSRLKKAEGSLLTPPEMEAEVENSAPLEDTYDNIPADEMAEAVASQEPDGLMEENFQEYILDQALLEDEQMQLASALEGNEQLATIFSKIMDVAAEFSGDGAVEGTGTGVSDSIPARLSDGEFVITAKATEYIGAENLQRIMDDAERASDEQSGTLNSEAT